MKKLIALFATSALASTAAVGSVALSGTASVTYDDNGSSPSATTYDSDLTVVGTSGGTTLTATFDMDGGGTNTLNHMATTGVDLATTIGPVTIAADMFNEVTLATTSSGGGQSNEGSAADDTGVTVSVDVPIGDATVALDNSGNVILSGTWSGVTLSHTVGDTTSTTASVALAGIDMNVTNKAGATTWDIATTVSGIDLTLTSGQTVTAAFGLAGNTMTVSSFASAASAAASAGIAGGNHTNGYGNYSAASAAAYATVAISRDLTSGASLTATYDTSNDSLTLKAAVTF